MNAVLNAIELERNRYLVRGSIDGGGTGMKTAYKFRMYPNKQQEASLDLTLDTCRCLYNLALADRKNGL